MFDFESVVILPRLRICDGGCEFDGEQIDLTPFEGAVLQRLIEKKPYPVTDERLMAAMHGGGEWPEWNSAKGFISRIRTKLKPFGITIENIRSQGYRLKYG